VIGFNNYLLIYLNVKICWKSEKPLTVYEELSLPQSIHEFEQKVGNKRREGGLKN
jgi:hypothetical protein